MKKFQRFWTSGRNFEKSNSPMFFDYVFHCFPDLKIWVFTISVQAADWNTWMSVQTCSSLSWRHKCFPPFITLLKTLLILITYKLVRTFPRPFHTFFLPGSLIFTQFSTCNPVNSCFPSWAAYVCRYFFWASSKFVQHGCLKSIAFYTPFVQQFDHHSTFCIGPHRSASLLSFVSWGILHVKIM